VKIWKNAASIRLFMPKQRASHHLVLLKLDSMAKVDLAISTGAHVSATC
jgi:hypothetical protein